ncbi:MEKHLA domain-containing protein [Leptolyngbya sp. FACHB-261]|uniref:MEKHLA domain-containing protein n=1 Tax=Leptolyngbya sp. FACHB-261 TaxID=2692806 RepID=UPI0016824054|nr:MEKHLA domain-containing protein [Leptolyngbya sp. FACHB-261]MBD2099746.1 MEKHLA domain-containing protein [Leptolyngbya sp. FACHB-261]
MLPQPSQHNDFLVNHAAILLDNFSHWTGKTLLDPKLSLQEQAQQLFYAPFVVLSHSNAPEPIFTYGNNTALRLFELSWQELIQMPSRLSAEPVHQSERQRLLTTVAAQGYIDDYSGVRISKTGRRFSIEQATIWNLLDQQNQACGQAAMFSSWVFLQ